MLHAVFQQRRNHLNRVRARHDRLHRINRLMHASGNRKRSAVRRRQNREPSQTQQQLVGCRQMQQRDGLELVRVDVRLIEAIEQHEPLRADRVEPRGEVRQRRIEGRELDGERNRDRFLQHRDDVEQARLDRRRIFGGIGREMIEVQLDRIGLRPLEKPRVLQPALRRRAVDRRDDRHRDAGFDAPKLLEISIGTERKSRRARTAREESALRRATA